MTRNHATREAWLNAAVTLYRPTFTALGRPLPEVIRVSTGWPRKHAKGSAGWCYKTEAAEDASTNIFVTPEVKDARIVLAILGHELIHAADDCASKHSGQFAKDHKALGFAGKPTGCDAGAELATELERMATRLGPYPHASLNGTSTEPKKQSTRMIKLACVDEGMCGMIIRTTAKWIESVGAPSCACGSGPMVNPEEEPEDEDRAEDEEAKAAWREREGDWGP